MAVGAAGPNAWREALARQVGQAYARSPHVVTVLIAGSVSRGHADRYSDIELMIGWDQAPSDHERRAIVQPFAADLRLLPFEEEWECWQEDFFASPGCERSSAGSHAWESPPPERFPKLD